MREVPTQIAHRHLRDARKRFLVPDGVLKDRNTLAHLPDLDGQILGRGPVVNRHRVGHREQIAFQRCGIRVEGGVSLVQFVELSLQVCRLGLGQLKFCLQVLDKLSVRICHGGLWFVPDRIDPTVGRRIHHIMKTADEQGGPAFSRLASPARKCVANGAANGVAARLLSNPWRVSAPWKAWPARSQSPEDLHWKEQLDAHADKARQEVMDHLVSLCGNYLRLSAVMSLQPPRQMPLPSPFSEPHLSVRARGTVELHQVDLMGKFDGMGHARAHVDELLKACQRDDGKAELLRQCVNPPSPAIHTRWHGIDHIKACDVAGRLIDVCIVWSAGQCAWSGEASSSTRHIALAGEFLGYAGMLQGSPEQCMQDQVRKASGHLDLVAKIATLIGDPPSAGL